MMMLFMILVLSFSETLCCSLAASCCASFAPARRPHCFTARFEQALSIDTNTQRTFERFSGSMRASASIANDAETASKFARNACVGRPSRGSLVTITKSV